MTDEQIIKALEHCTSSLSIEACDGCPMNKGVCDKDLNALEKHALDLIKRQKTEIEILIRKKETLRDEITEKDAEIERLKNAYKQCAWERDVLGKYEAYREFAKEFVDDLSHMLTYDKDYIKAKIFKLLESKQKELTEKNDKE